MKDISRTLKQVYNAQSAIVVPASGTFGMEAVARQFATLPTDVLPILRNVMAEAEAYGFDKVRAEQQKLGDKVRALLEQKGFKSVAAQGYKAPGVVVRAAH